MSTRICPVCGADYLDWADTCTVCGVALVAPSEAPDPLRLPEDQQVVYELGEWPLGLQATAAQALAESGIPHGWNATDLVVHLDHEATVDAMLEEIEAEAGLAPAGVSLVAADPADPAEDAAATDTEEAELEPGQAEALEYELDEWSAQDRVELSRQLAEGGIPYRWEEDDLLVVAARDEELVEAILDAIEYPDALSPEEGDDDEAPSELMGELFVAADRLKANPRDPEGLRGLSEFIGVAQADEPPYGVEPALWRSAVEGANDLADRITAGDDDHVEAGDLDEDGYPVPPGQDLTRRARDLRELLRPFV
jgi:hypothetical protein